MTDELSTPTSSSGEEPGGDQELSSAAQRRLSLLTDEPTHVNVVLLVDADEGQAEQTVNVPASRAKTLIRGGAAQPASKDDAATLDALYYGP